MSQTKFLYESGLDDIALCGNIHAIRQKVKQLLNDLDSDDPEPQIQYPKPHIVSLAEKDVANKLPSFVEQLSKENLPETSLFVIENKPLIPVSAGIF